MALSRLLPVFSACKQVKWTSSGLFQTCIRTINRPGNCRLSGQQIQQMSTKKSLPFEGREVSKLVKDILVYSHKEERFFKLMTYFGIAQFVFWSNLAYFAYQNFKDELEQKKSADDPWYKQVLAMDGKYKNGITFMFLALGM